MKKITKFISIILAAIVIVSTLSVGVSAATLDDGMFEYEIVNGKAILTDCSETALGTVVVPSFVRDYKVTEIAVEAFDDCVLIDEIIISEGIEEIGSDAFIDCIVLDVVRLPISLKKIRQGAFFRCDSIERVYYAGNSSDWDKIEISQYNEDLTEADIYFGIETQNGIYFEYEDLYMDYKGEDHVILGADRDLSYYEWYSLDESIATVDNEGKVTAVGTGITQICCYAEDYNGNCFIEECEVMVSYNLWQWLIVIFLFGWIWY